MSEVRSASCPECGNPMDRGFLRAESYIGGAVWTAKRARLGARAEPLVKPDGLGYVYLAGYRCPRCRFLTLHY